MRRIRPLIGIAAGAALALVLTGCSQGESSGPVWTPDSDCPTPAAVADASMLPPLRFSAQTSKTETLAGTGCSYLTLDGKTQLNVERDPGPPSDVAFGTAAHLTISKRPALGSGAETARSADFCALIAPASGGATLQIQVINSANASITQTCGHLGALLTRFARRSSD